jgi:2-dehydro-3-deoxygalactonokinase
VVADIRIGVDWGASRVRAFLYDAGGMRTDFRERACDLLTMRTAGFETFLAELTEDWRAMGPASFVLCGMVGSRHGWMEAPYVSCPAGAEEIAAGLRPVFTALGRAVIAPGLSFESSDRADVMRGEETQILGAVGPDWTGVTITPGTHSKWATLESGRITRFRTWMTGELYALLKNRSLLGRLMTPGNHDSGAFALGVLRAFEDRAITALLFSVRAEALLARIAPPSLASYLSGLLIGSEVSGGLAIGGAAAPFAIIGAPALTALYAAALALGGRNDALQVNGDEAAARGLWRLDQWASGVAV